MNSEITQLLNGAPPREQYLVQDAYFICMDTVIYIRDLNEKKRRGNLTVGDVEAYRRNLESAKANAERLLTTGISDDDRADLQKALEMVDFALVKINTILED
jgi:hypothetical protein